MAIGWRIVPARHLAGAFNGVGARLNGGRWNSPGTLMVYASEHKSLAALEILVHVDPLYPLGYAAFRFECEDSLIEKAPLAILPTDWREEPPSPTTMQIGDQWVREERTAILAVPSAIIPEEWNYLLNPSHPDFSKIKISPPSPFAFDLRLLK